MPDNLLLDINYKYTGLIGGVVWSIVLFYTKIELSVFLQIFSIISIIIIFNFSHTKMMANSKNISYLNKIFAGAVNISLVTALIYYTGGSQSNLWIIFLLVLMSFSLIYTKKEMFIATLFVVGTYSLFYLPEIRSVEFFFVDFGPLFLKIGLLFMAGISLKKIVDFQMNYLRLSDELEKTKAQVIHSEKMSVLSKIFSSTAHELTNQLAGIVGFSQLLLDSECSKETKSDLKLISKNAIQCKNTVRNLLMFSCCGERVDKCIDVNRVLEDALSFRLYQLTLDNIEVIKTAGKYLPRITADPYRLLQVFVNIINNAHDAMMSQNGKKHKLMVSSEFNKQKIIVKFSDTGPGIPRKIISNIFDPFFTTKEEGKGTGLGLSISKDIIQQYGGRIYAESTENKGATFIVEFPISKIIGIIKQIGMKV